MTKTTGNFEDFITFTRASAATVRDAADGDRIKWPGHNYMPQSEDLTDTDHWLTTNTTTAVVDVPAPVEGQVLEVTDTGAGDTNHYIRMVGLTHTSAGNQRWAAGAIFKSNGGNVAFWLGTGGTPRAQVTFDLLSGVIMAPPAALVDWVDPAASMTPLGDGWYYVEISARVVTGSVMQLYIWPTKPDGDRTYVADGTNKILVMRPRIFRDEVPMLANPAEPLDPTYYPTKGAFRTLDNLPRGNQPTGTAGKRGLLVEPARTNLWKNSVAGVFTGSNVSVSTESVSSPIGQVGALKTQANAGAASIFQVQDISSTTGWNMTVDGCVSFFIKVHTPWLTAFSRITAVMFDEADLTQSVSAGFKLSDGTMSGMSAGANGTAGSQGIEDYGDGWYWVWFSGIVNSAGPTSGTLRLTVRHIDDNFSGSWTAAGGEGAYFTGFQAENGARYPSSYIPTAGAAATRAGETARMSQNSFGTNGKVGTWFAEMLMPLGIQAAGSTYIVDGEYPPVYINNSNAQVNSWSGSSAVGGFTYTPGAISRYAVAALVSSARACFNGGTIDVEPTGDWTTIADLNSFGLAIGSRNDAATDQLGGVITAVKFYPRALSDAQLQELTA